jgi:hypothetical protein
MTQENEWILRWKTIRWGAVPFPTAAPYELKNDVSLIAGDKQRLCPEL